LQSVATLSAPFNQSGVVWPPWQLTFEQVRPAELYEKTPDLASYVANPATLAGELESK